MTDSFTLPAQSELRLSDVLALANTYLDLQRDLDLAVDRLSDNFANMPFGSSDDEFRAWLNERAALDTEVEQRAALATAAYDTLCELMAAMPEGCWTYSGGIEGRTIRVRYEPVTRMVTAWRVEAQ